MALAPAASGLEMEAVLLATDTAFEVIVMDEIFAPGLERMRGSAAITEVRPHEVRAGVARRAVIVSCTGNASSITNLDRSGADLVWRKPMPNFTNGEMQNELAPQLAAKLKTASLARAQLHEGDVSELSRTRSDDGTGRSAFIYYPLAFRVC